jgi:flagellar basal-body rod protein FlgB
MGYFLTQWGGTERPSPDRAKTWARRVLHALAVSEIFTAIGSLHRSLDYHLERHNVLSSNVAHVDTPGYRPKDLERVGDLTFAGVFDVALRRTSELHLADPAGSQASSLGRVFEDLSAGVGNDGNYVSLDREASKLAANHLRYDTISAIVSAEIRQLSFAANDAKG